ncbi:MAG: hypothetical protein J6X55_17635 [Victivallales bacterium]|nr:hypothetical protein [Victivallales bacterium]
MAYKIIGMGLVSAMGGSVDEVFKAMCGGGDAFRELTRFDSTPYAQRHGGQLDDALEDELRAEFPDDDIAIAMMKHAGNECVHTGSVDANGTTGLVLATNFGPMETLEWAWRERFDTGTLDEASYSQFAHVLDIVGDYFKCNGPRVQLSMSCASGAAAAAVASDMIASGRARRVLVLAYDALTEYCWCGLSNLHTITTDTMRPFDVKRSGTLFSEGAAAMMLAHEDDDGKPLAWLAGSATNNNAYHITAPRKEGEGSRQTMAAALKKAGLSPEDIGHICAHGTSTRANDETEAGAFRNLFGNHLADMTAVAHKSQLGHLLGAAGLAEAVITMKSMETGVIPPTLRLENLDSACHGVNMMSNTNVHSVTSAVTNSAGIGGNNASLVLTTDKPSVVGGSMPTIKRLYVRGLSWILPQNIGCGRDFIDHSEWLANDGRGLEGFSPRSYVSSVKGYLDPAGAYMLSAFSLLKKGEENSGFNERCGIATMTRFGACKSAYTFFEQLATKGARFASPMIFPHGYANTAGNLAAIEFGCCGPHIVFYGEQNPVELLEFAAERFRHDEVDEMLLGCYEATVPTALPDGWKVLNGAIGLKVAAKPSEDDLFVIDLAQLQLGVPQNSSGAVDAFGSMLLKALMRL